MCNIQIGRAIEKNLVKIGKLGNMIDLVGLTVTDITDKPVEVTGRRHWDMWYRVGVGERYEFEFDRGEFYEARWFGVEETLEKVGNEGYKKVIECLFG